MDTLSQYRAIVQAALHEYYTETTRSPVGPERQLVLDPERDHYLLMVVGWQQKRRVDGCILHVDIKDGQVWVQYDGTEGGIANELAARGIPKADIVLGFHAPYKRHLTGFGVERTTSESQPL